MTRHDGVPCDPLAVREITGNLTTTTNDVIAWYRVPPKAWSFTTDGRRADTVLELARRLAQLAGTSNVHLRVTSRPYPVRMWAKHLDETTRAAAHGPLPGVEGNTWYDHLEAAQRRLYQQVLADKEVYLGVPVRDRSWINRIGEKWSRTGLTEREERATAKRVAEVAEILAGPGSDARTATGREVEWLMHRSVGLLMPAPVHVSPIDDPRWEPDDLAAFTDGIDYEAHPFGRTVKVIDTRLRKPIERHVAVLTIGRMGGVDTIPQTPWVAASDWLPFPVEWSARLDVLSGSDAAAEINKHLRVLRDQQKHYREHELDEPLDLAIKAEDARRIEHEMTDGEVVISTRVHGWWRIAVSGATEEECLTRCRQVRDLYDRQQITVQHPRGQYALLREFIPGEPLGGTAYKRHLPVRIAAAAVPQVSASVGDGFGHYIGYTAGRSRRPVLFDPHYGPEVREQSGFVPVIGEQGSGKSVLLGDMAYLESRANVTTTLLDPGGPLAGLTRLPELAAVSQHLDLLRGEPGSLNPATVIADPLPLEPPEAYGDDYDDARTAYEGAVAVAKRTRKMLMSDIARQLLPPSVARSERTVAILGDAIRHTSGARTSSLADVLERLDKHTDPYGHTVADLPRDVREMPQATLFFPPDAGALDTRDTEATLLVLTMEGLTLPDADSPPEGWSVDEQMSVPLLHLATYYATRRIYGLPRQQRKFIGLDEVGQMGRWGSGKALFTGLARQSRKWNAAVFASSQNPEDVLGLKVANFVSTAFVGRIEDPDIATEALTLLRIPKGTGYESAIHALSPQQAEGRRQHREFIMRDGSGNREVVRIDMEHYPHVLEAINSTPGARTERTPRLVA